MPLMVYIYKVTDLKFWQLPINWSNVDLSNEFPRLFIEGTDEETGIRRYQYGRFAIITKAR